MVNKKKRYAKILRTIGWVMGIIAMLLIIYGILLNLKLIPHV